MADKADTTVSDDFIEGNLFIEDADTFIDSDDESSEENQDDDDDEDETDIQGQVDPDDDDDDDDDDDEEEDEEEEDEDENSDDDDEEDEEDTEDKSKETKTTEDSDNEAYLLADHWKQSGRLPADLEIKPDITELELEDLVAAAFEEKVEARIRGKYDERLRARNINPDEVFGDEMWEKRQEQSQYASIAKLNYDDLLTNAEEKGFDVIDTIKNIGIVYHMSKNPALEESEAQTLVAKDLNGDDEEATFSKYQKFFQTESQNLGKNISEWERSQKQKSISKTESDAAYVRKSLEEGKIGGRKYTAEEIQKIQDGLYKVDQVYVDPRGGRHRVSLFEKKRREAADNLDKQMELASHLILGINKEKIQEQAERAGSMKTLSKLAQAAGIGGTKNGKSKKQISNKKNTRREEALFLNDN